MTIGTKGSHPARLASVHPKGLTTKAIASALGYQTQSIHSRLCRHGDFYGIRPRKLPSGRLVWPADTVERLLGEKEEA